MLSDEGCKKILNRNGNNYTDEQIRNIRDFLWSLAQLEVKTLDTDYSDENSCNNEQGKQ
jgi:hypothetical protein